MKRHLLTDGPAPEAETRWAWSWAMASCLCAWTAAASANAPDGAWRPLNDYALQRVIVGAEVGAARAGNHRFLANGIMTITVNGRTHQGRWQIARDELCMVAEGDTGQGECYEVQQRGNQLRLLQDGYVILHGRVARTGAGR